MIIFYMNQQIRLKDNSKLWIAGIQTFLHYDFGPRGNWLKYGQLKPPVYDLKKVTCSVNIFYGPNDYLVVPKVRTFEMV